MSDVTQSAKDAGKLYIRAIKECGGWGKFWEDIKTNVVIRHDKVWYDLWVGIYINFENHFIYIGYFPTRIIVIDLSGLDMAQEVNRLIYESDEWAWLCFCGHYETSSMHCRHCQRQPPWGCDCSDCVFPEDLPIIEIYEDEVHHTDVDPDPAWDEVYWMRSISNPDPPISEDDSKTGSISKAFGSGGLDFTQELGEGFLDGLTKGLEETEDDHDGCQNY